MGLKTMIPSEIRNSQFSKLSGIADEMDCVFTVSIIARREYTVRPRYTRGRCRAVFDTFISISVTSRELSCH